MYNAKGTNSGPMGAMQAANKAIDVNGVDIVKFADGKGVEHGGYTEESKMIIATTISSSGTQKVTVNFMSG